MSNEERNQTAIPVSIEWVFPENVPTRFANNIVVRRGQNEVFISFFEIAPPMIFGTPEQQREQAKDLHSIEALCVAQVVIPLEKLSEVIEVLQTTQAQSKSTNASE